MTLGQTHLTREVKRLDEEKATHAQVQATHAEVEGLGERGSGFQSATTKLQMDSLPGSQTRKKHL